MSGSRSRIHVPAGCPNTPPCPHPALVHEGGHLDLVEVCLPGCSCGRDVEDVVRRAFDEARRILEGV